MKKKYLIIIFFFFNSCAYFDEAEEILPGKRESVFKFEDDIIIKSNKRIKIDKSISVDSWSQQYQNERNHLFHFKSKSKLSIKKKIKLNDIAFDKIDHVTIPVFDLKNNKMKEALETFEEIKMLPNKPSSLGLRAQNMIDFLKKE